MKTKMLFIFLILSLLIASAEAQNYVFKVLGAKGRITVNNLPVKVGSQVAANQVIKIVGANGIQKSLIFSNKANYARGLMK
ncbi:MAG: hypothetical protein ACK40V_07995 [Anaerolineales bacterium]